MARAGPSWRPFYRTDFQGLSRIDALYTAHFREKRRFNRFWVWQKSLLLFQRDKDAVENRGVQWAQWRKCNNKMPDLRWCLMLWNIVVEEKMKKRINILIKLNQRVRSGSSIQPKDLWASPWHFHCRNLDLCPHFNSMWNENLLKERKWVHKTFPGLKNSGGTIWIGTRSAVGSDGSQDPFVLAGCHPHSHNIHRIYDVCHV